MLCHLRVGASDKVKHSFISLTCRQLDDDDGGQKPTRVDQHDHRTSYQRLIIVAPASISRAYVLTMNIILNVPRRKTRPNHLSVHRGQKYYKYTSETRAINVKQN